MRCTRTGPHQRWRARVVPGICGTVRAAHQKVDEVVAQRVIQGFAKQRLTGTIARQGNFHELGDSGAGSVAHKHDAVGQQYGLIDVVRDHEHRLTRGRNDTKQFVLNRAARQGIERAEGLVEQQHFGLNGKRPGNAHALLHAAGKLGGFFVERMAQIHHLEIMAAVIQHLAARPLGHRERTANATLPSALNQGSRAWP